QFCNNSPIILADKEELRRAFMNIIRNSVQAMNEMGTISIRSSIEKQNAIIMVTDSGSGIAPEIRDRLFEPNFSTKTDGMGMGLAIVKKTIDDLNGTISIESEPQKGTTVSVTLPIVLEF
ncbi:MAG: ATP-binding protein, partial [Bacteroidetes bacterium]